MHLLSKGQAVTHIYTQPRGRAIARTAGVVWEGLKRLPATSAALVCTGVGVSYNASFASQFGEAAIALAVASDILKAASGPIFMSAIAAREWGRAGAALLVGIVTLAVSLVAAFGSAQHVREANTDERRAAIRAFDDAEKLKAAIETELALLGNPRPVAMIQSDIKNFPIDARLWSRSNQCEDATKPDTQAYCQPIIDLYKERGAAARKTEIEANGKDGFTLAQLNAIIAKGKPAHADPQAAAIASLTGFHEDHIRIGISILIVAVIEVGTFGGSIMAAKPMPKRIPANPANDAGPAKQAVRKPKSGNPPPRGPRRKAGRPSDGRVVDFVERFRTKHGRAPSGTEIRSAFPDIPKSTAFDHAARGRILGQARASA